LLVAVAVVVLMITQDNLVVEVVQEVIVHQVLDLLLYKDQH